MSKLYSIQESTLTDIGNALRSKYGETRIEIERTPPFILIKSSKATDFNTYGGYTGPDTVHVFKCPGANYIKLVYTTNINDGGNYIKYAIGEYTKSTFPTDGIVLENATEPNIITIEADTITIRVYDVSWKNRGYYIQATGYDAANNPIELEGSTIIEKEIEVPNTYSSAEVAAAIEGLSTTPEPIVLSGDCSYACAGALASNYIKLFGDTITTKDITTAERMFNNCQFVKTIPFEINLKANSSTSLVYMFNNCYELENIVADIDCSHSDYASMVGIFYNCSKLKEVPYLFNAYPNSFGNLFSGCYCLREIPEDYFDTWNFSRINSYKYASDTSLFRYCYSLRNIPTKIFSYLCKYNENITSKSSMYCLYDYGCAYCHSLDEIIGFPVAKTLILTSNMFNNTFSECSRLKNMTFETNEDGTSIMVQWKSQIIDFSTFIGYAYVNDKNNILNYNSGITADKEVKDNATYQALKNDPDWFTTNIAYSRYNHDSAVVTINSLPDASAYLTANGGTNTIKFKGAAGSATDGGAINTLTEEEIAVAAAKGWTVSFV